MFNLAKSAVYTIFYIPMLVFKLCIIVVVLDEILPFVYYSIRAALI